jgi:acyl dehydratase
MESVRTPADLEGQPIGPVDVAITADRVELYVDVTGDDPERWTTEAPPGFASVLLFAVADEFLYHPRIVEFTATLLHLDQTFRYLGPMRIGTTTTVEGSITRVRERAGSYFVTFEASASDGHGPVLESRSTFVLSDRKAPPPAETHDEPPVRYRRENSLGRRSASRHDLVRYAGATRDFNPFHWDHDFAVDSGLPGIVVHGLLMYAWMVQAASRAADGRPIVEAKIRFRAALHPAEQAEITAVLDADRVAITLDRGEEQLVSGAATVGSHEE